jgi:hypothetical protein
LEVRIANNAHPSPLDTYHNIILYTPISRVFFSQMACVLNYKLDGENKKKRLFIFLELLPQQTHVKT